MSAYMLSDAHIDVLLDCAQQFTRDDPTCQHWPQLTIYAKGAPELVYRFGENENEIGRMLLAEISRSVAFRYRESDGNRTPDPAALTYRYRPTGRRFDAQYALKALACYEYQACECEDFAQRPAAGFVNALRAQIIHVALPYRDSDPWDIAEADLGRAVLR